jgi:hypothetical protein
LRAASPASWRSSRPTGLSRPTRSDVACGTGFRFVEHRVVWQLTSPSLRAYAERIRLRAISHLERLGAAEFARGMAELDRLAAAETVPSAVVEGIDLVVLASAAQAEEPRR